MYHSQSEIYKKVFTNAAGSDVGHAALGCLLSAETKAATTSLG